MNWTDLQCFLVMHTTGSIARSADTLGVNHTTVLRRLGHLEEALGLRLFERFQSGYVITSAGEELAGKLAGIQEQIDAATRQVMSADLEIRGTIRLTSTDTLFESLLMPYLKEFQARHPKIQLQMVLNNTFMSLTKREADVAVRGSNHPPENLIGRRAGRIQTAPFASKTYLAANPHALSWEEHVWVGADESLAHIEQSKWLSSNVPKQQIGACIDSLVGMVECVRQGMGVGMLLCPLAEKYPDLVRLADPLAVLDTQIWILTHPDLKRVARVKALTEFLYEKLSSDSRLVANNVVETVAKKSSGSKRVK